MTADQAIVDFVTPLLPGWAMQMGRWVDEGRDQRYAVLRPVGGSPAELVRRPQFSLIFVGAENESIAVPRGAAETVAVAMSASSGSLVLLQPGEPVFMATSDGRPIFELAVSAINNLELPS